jgi:hypothetical protein
VAATVLLAIAGCAGSTGDHVDGSGLPTNRPVSQGDLSGLPGAHLYYPGSTVVQPVGASQTPTHPGEEPNPAYTGAILSAPASPAALYAWYAAALAARGYTAATSFRPSAQTSARAWQRRHRVQVQVGVFDLAALRADLGISVPVRPGVIAYEAVLVGYPPGLPKE